jgi:hypothetical protein
MWIILLVLREQSINTLQDNLFKCTVLNMYCDVTYAIPCASHNISLCWPKNHRRGSEEGHQGNPYSYYILKNLYHFYGVQTYQLIYFCLQYCMNFLVLAVILVPHLKNSTLSSINCLYNGIVHSMHFASSIYITRAYAVRGLVTKSNKRKCNLSSVCVSVYYSIA